MLSGRRMGKSMLTREYMKLMQEDADKITQGASRISGASMTFASMDEYESMTDEKIESKIAALRKMQGLEGEDMAKSKTGAPAISPEAVFALEELARSMTERLRDMPPLVKRVTLSRPGQLTVLRKAGYGKKPHLVGEEFEMTGVRVGSPQKGSRMIFEFKPTSVAEYDTMEMAQMECESSLNDWRLAVDRAVGGNFYMALEEVRNIDAAKLHEEERKRLAQEYQEFGAW